jgi:endonuclease/exonuclease/phosphatase family metal-dependent hydrolase
MEEYARRLVLEEKIPFVLYHSDRPWAMTENGRIDLSRGELLLAGEKHPFAEQIQEDLLRVCLHQDAGDFVIGCWRQDDQALTFPDENGAHGGPGRHECCGFLIIPDFLAGRVKFWRPAVLRENILAFRQNAVSEPYIPRRAGGHNRRLRLVTYNIHSCIGLDGRILPERIARIIGRLALDLVCLQEVDRGTGRSDGRDQAADLAEILGMRYVFLPLKVVDGGEYGIAVLSRLPFKIMKQDSFSSTDAGGRQEKRGAIWLELESDGRPVHLVNTHFGLTGRGRRRQLDCLFGAEWLADSFGESPLVVCGDFNSGLRSPIYRRLTARLIDARSGSGLPLPATFSSIQPFLHLDHIFHSRHFRVIEAQVRRSTDCRLASDHLPLFAELELQAGGDH